MSVILARKLPDFVSYTLSVLMGFLFGAVILLGLPLKWIIAVILAIGFTVFLLIVRDAERVSLFALFLIIPFHIGVGLPDLLTHLGHIGMSNLGVQLIDILVLSLLMCRLARLATHQTEIRLYPSTTVPALAWLVASALSAVNAREVDLTVIQVGQMVKLLLLYIVVANVIRDETDIKWLVWALSLGVLFQGLLGLYQEISGGSLGLSFLGEPRRLYYGRPLGTIGHPNGYGAYLSATMPLALAMLFMEGRTLRKVLVGVVLCVGALGLLFSLSRGGWLSFAVAFIMVLVFAIRRGRQNLHIAYVGAGSILLVLLSLTLSQRDLVTARLTSEQSQESALSRITMAKGATAMIQDYPLLGVGANNYSLLMPEYDPFDFASQRRIVIVHNIYLLIAAETGLVGLAAFLWFLASLFAQARRLISRAPNDTVWLAGVGAFSAFAALAIHGIADYDVLANLTVFRLLWLFAAIVAGLSANLRRERVAGDYSKLCENDTGRRFHRDLSQVGSRGSWYD